MHAFHGRTDRQISIAKKIVRMHSQLQGKIVILVHISDLLRPWHFVQLSVCLDLFSVGLLHLLSARLNAVIEV